GIRWIIADIAGRGTGALWENPCARQRYVHAYLSLSGRDSHEPYRCRGHDLSFLHPLPFESDLLRQANGSCLLHGGYTLQFTDDSLGNRAIHVHNGDGLARSPRHRFFASSSQREVGDVDPMFAQDGSDLTNNTGHVLVPHVDQVLLQRSFRIDSVDMQEASRLFVQHRALHDMAAFVAFNGDGDDAAYPAAGCFWFFLFLNLHSAI